MTTKNPGVSGTVLLVDDEAVVLDVFTRYLELAGFQVETCQDGREALDRIAHSAIDVVVSDISMPGTNGVELLRAVRRHDRDLPVVLMTGAPTVESAAEAVEYGAFKYLLKPFTGSDLINTVTHAIQLRRLAEAKREAFAVLGSVLGESSDRAGLEASFEGALNSMWIAFQPILRVSDRTLFGYEALLRSGEPRLPHPGAILDAAERLGQLDRLGKAIRNRAISRVVESEGSWRLFLNLHPADLLDPGLLEGPIVELAGTGRVVLEVTERASLDRVSNIASRIAALRSIGCAIAVDDLGAGYAGLSSFVQLEPEFVKLDVSLVRDIDRSPVKQKLVRSMTALSQEMGLQVVGEGVETPEERDALVELGCDLLQGYLFGKPEKDFVEAFW